MDGGEIGACPEGWGASLGSLGACPQVPGDGAGPWGLYAAIRAYGGPRSCQNAPGDRRSLLGRSGRLLGAAMERGTAVACGSPSMASFISKVSLLRSACS